MATESRVIRSAATASRNARSGSSTWAQPPALLILAMSALLILGLIMILSASSVASFANYGSAFLFFKKQLVWAVIGIVAFITSARFDYRKLRGLGYVLVPFVLFLMFLVLIPGLGVTSGGSSRWLGFGPVSVQPSELAKLALILFIADVFSRKNAKTVKKLSHAVMPVIPVVGFMSLLVMAQPDMGTTMLLGIIAFGMLFVSGTPMRYLVSMGTVGAGVAALGALAEPYRRARVLAFLNPWSDPLNTGYQTIQSLIAMGSGGFFGVGLGASRQKWMYVPNAHTDFIYAILGEEMGLFGTLMVLGLFAFVAYLGIRIARNARDRFGMYLASGVTIWITFQALVNIGAVTASLPVTGVPLPFVSFGGSSLVVSLVGMGILTNIARQSRVRSKK